MTSRLVLICHAATAATRTGAFPLDEPVEKTPAPAPARADVYLTGPETRCRQTAKALGLSATVDEDLRDCDHGTWRGQTLDDLVTSAPTAVTQWLTDPSAAPHEGESIVDLIARVGEWLDEVRYDHTRIVAVTHPAVIRAAIVHAILATPRSFWRIDVPSLSRTVLSGRPSSWTLRLPEPSAQ
ncbi:histidine phosphatase family protein [Actinophytocola oryzae]|uniref:Broad specificity phosphatase PhoE n=1 Tax=Actinophytocola oryzae TaxID=502181 RepID=A0A4V3FUZ7_9PSEU|nr:histidine phosphatase family protein [Actinophytocola oryzae]TDV57171.1 broad specificity phosphatase PhoE [Actinophytocola oryzae]